MTGTQFGCDGLHGSMQDLLQLIATNINAVINA
jgi:hypothetical protein